MKRRGSQGATVEVVGPDGKRPLVAAGGGYGAVVSADAAGFYQMRFANGRDALIAVNPDRRESDLELIPAGCAEALERKWRCAMRLRHSGDCSGYEEKKSAYSLWWWVMLLILMAAVAESVVASRYLGTQREEA